MMKPLILCLFAIFIFNQSDAQVNYLDSYLANPVTMTPIGTFSNQVDQPRDLDFKPNSNELWVCNYGSASGGSMVIFYNAGLPNQTSEYRKDTHSSHFMAYPSAMAFGNNGEWAAVSEIQNTNPNATTFMGPALWLSDTSIFARVFQNNWVAGLPLGSHIDMLHQSPFAMGIAHDTLKAYYVMDGHNGNICRYDFVQDHGPGYDNHSAGKIWRYIDVPVTRVADKPSHMVLDKSSGWLYFIDGGSKEIKRMDTNTGSVTGNLTTPPTAMEVLAGYYKVEGAVVEVIDSLTTQPCGIDFFNNRLVVTDNTTGDIYLYNTSGPVVTLMGTIATGQPGLMGVKIGPDGKIWCVNRPQHTVYRLDVAAPANDLAITKITYPLVSNFTPAFYSVAFNVCDGSITPEISVTNTGTSTITTTDYEYTIDGGSPVTHTLNISIAPGASTNLALPSSPPVSNGTHLLSVRIVSVNGVADDIVQNNILDGSFRIIDPMVPAPYYETFTSSTFPPTGWNYIHFNPNNKMSWENPGGFGQSTGSLRMDNFSGDMDITGQQDILFLPTIDLSGSVNNYLKFDVAYAKYNSSSLDRLQAWVTNDCGVTWTNIYNKAGTTLSTAPVTTNAFVPTATQWRTDSVDLVAWVSQPGITIAFATISDYGNHLYIDNVFVGDITTGLPTVAESDFFTIYPNPVDEELMIHVSSALKQIATGELFSVEGKLVKKFEITPGTSDIVIDVADLTDGFYTVRISSAASVFVQSLIKN